ncbi:hypothetical protein [Winogradskyella tangerina]|uniref:hypothetical protein n=1 Tax=Winogradskyella tangerina TaxID=2023240 RepID=UPI000DBE9E3E|nr:hypothetical protein [Winogradskyella tangerina]
MKSLFNYLLLILITSAPALAQRNQILKESIDLDKNSTVKLDIENIYLAIEESTDGKIHFDYALEFDGYSKKAIREKLDGIETDIKKSGSTITLKANSMSQISFQSFALTSEHGLYMEDDLFGKRSDTVYRKSTDSLLTEIRKNNRSNWAEDPLKYLNGKFKKMDKDGNLSAIRKGNVKIMRSQFVIKIPPFVKLNIESKNSGIYFRNDVQNELVVTSKQGNFKAKALTNTFNFVQMDNVHFEAESLVGGVYELKNVNGGKIGRIKEAKINSEFSKIEIGEVGTKTIINDFNSQYWLYNWTLNFDKALMDTEYSKINIFFPQNMKYQLATFGHNTVHFYLGVTTEIAPSRENKSTFMMNFGSSADPNKIQVNTIHGIVRFGEDYIHIKR